MEGSWVAISSAGRQGREVDSNRLWRLVLWPFKTMWLVTNDLISFSQVPLL